MAMATGTLSAWPTIGIMPWPIIFQPFEEEVRPQTHQHNPRRGSLKG